jgi:integrase/recombinase XerD
LWPWKTNTQGEHPVKIRVTFAGERRYFPALDSDSKKMFTSKADAARKKGKALIADAEFRAKAALQAITKGGKPFSFDRFQIEYFGQQAQIADGLLSLFQKHLADIKKEGRIGTFKSYYNAFRAFNKFRGGKTTAIEGTRQKADRLGRELAPIDLTPTLLKEFENYLRTQGAGRTTIAIYMRSLKVVYNIASDINPSLREYYPFATRQGDRKKFKIKTGSGHKGQALDVRDLKAFMAIDTEQGTPSDEAKFLWLFSFYAQGMNMKDIALLTYGNTRGNVISYVREKTKRTEEKETPIEIPITDSIRQIIGRIGNPDKSDSAHVFDILRPGMTPEQIDATSRQKIKMVNARLKQLCKENDLPEITTYWARHTYASLLKEAGESVELIRELLGHSDIRTTEAYLKRFDMSKKRAVNERIESLLVKTA